MVVDLNPSIQIRLGAIISGEELCGKYKATVEERRYKII
jgi:hypothetical protein